ncbi:MAG TPA: EF-P lysine aminoacylase EpmA [Pirellulales bacterium]|nr:EF-P lysine aminoacylase EpmA [Pirellulales bacterium]
MDGTSSDDPAADFRPRAPWRNLRLRAELLRKARHFFDVRDFLEVETPLLSVDVVVDRHLDPLGVVLPDDPRRPEAGRRLWLQTSPEFAMKRLLATRGEQAPGAIFQITRAFRGGETGPLHNPEFTIVEWYRAGDDMAAGMALLSDLCEALLGRGPAERISYAAAFEKFVGLDPHAASSAECRAVAADCGIAVPDSLGDDRDGWLDLLLTERIQTHLGRPRPTILFDFPATQAALARIRAPDAGSGNPAVGERFELYVDGIELANGYHELLDAAELRRRQSTANAHRRADGRPALPETSRLLAAMEAGLPPATGVALGFDRLAMIAAGARDLREVIAFPIDRA